MKIVRVFLKPAAGKWVDLPLGDDEHAIARCVATLQSQGWITCSEWAVPNASVHHIELIHTAGEAEPPVPPWTKPGTKAN